MEDSIITKRESAAFCIDDSNTATESPISDYSDGNEFNDLAEGHSTHILPSSAESPEYLGTAGVTGEVTNISHNGRETCFASSNDDAAGDGKVAQIALTNIVMTVAYDGGEYNGFVGPNHFYNTLIGHSDESQGNGQRVSSYHPDSRSVSNEILRALAVIHGYLPNRRKRKKLLKKLKAGELEEGQEYCNDNGQDYILPTERRFTLISSSRTDKGVHAMETACQYLSFDKEPPLGGDLDCIMENVNRLLPDDIKVTSVINAPRPDFNVRFDNIGKIYMYKLDLSENPSLFDRKYYWQLYADRQFKNTLLNKFNDVRKTFSFDRMRAAADKIVGTHNFEALRKKSRGNEKGIPKDPICTIERIDIERHDTTPGEGKFHVTIKGDRFLYRMVAYDVLTVEQIEQMLETGTEIPHIQYAPSMGLYLVKVLFESEVEHELETSKERNRQRITNCLKPRQQQPSVTLLSNQG
ncbi:pseudouridylate synthase like protein [Babesia gibsoni]|uniref:tRNA pseudouridine synthase n=1 Tax=Babesia gibsoni TaxID=33632 RepID=A0AAD8LKX6_BABGI|nr:pseudouridylate synthase like protein [Babesia gibsoni]